MFSVVAIYNADRDKFFDFKGADPLKGPFAPAYIILSLDAKDELDACEAAFRASNAPDGIVRMDDPDDPDYPVYNGPSLSVGDLVVVIEPHKDGHNDTAVFRVDGVGFTKLDITPEQLYALPAWRNIATAIVVNGGAGVGTVIAHRWQDSIKDAPDIWR